MKTLPLLLAAAALACGDLRDIMSLEQGLVREFHEPGININLNVSGQLAIAFANSPAADLPDSEREAYARRVAEYVRDHFPRYDALTSISVGFTSVKRTGPLTVTNAPVPYRFTPRDLGAPRPSPKQLGPKREAS